MYDDKYSAGTLYVKGLKYVAFFFSSPHKGVYCYDPRTTFDFSKLPAYTNKIINHLAKIFIQRQPASMKN